MLRARMGIRAHPTLTSGKTSKGHYGTQSCGCAGQTVRPSPHSISQTSVGKPDKARGQIGNAAHKLAARYFDAHGDGAALVEADKVEGVLADVDADRGDGIG